MSYRRFYYYPHLQDYANLYNNRYYFFTDEQKIEWHKKLGCTHEFATAILEDNEKYKLTWHDRIVFQAHEPRREAYAKKQLGESQAYSTY